MSLLPGLALPAEAATPRIPILWGAYLDGAPWNMSVVSSFEADAGKGVSILEFGEPWYHGGAYQGFPINEVTAIRSHGSIPLITWGSWDYCCGTTQPGFSLAAITAGQHDAYLQQWAAAAAAWGHPLFLRLDPEMNGAWEEWSEQVNGNHPGDFVLQMWRHVRAIFARAGATNVSFVWCPNIEGTTSTPLKELYPGNAYVDWTGLDGYNWGTDEHNSWETFAQVFSGTPSYGGFNSYRDLQNLAPLKPMMIGEIASAEDGGSKAAWLMDMLQTQLPASYPNFRAFVWFNYYGGPGAPNWPIESSPSATAAFKKGIASSYFMANNFASLGGSGISGKPSGSSPMAGSALSTPAASAAPAGAQTGSSAENSASQTTAMMAAKIAYLRTHS